MSSSEPCNCDQSRAAATLFLAKNTDCMSRDQIGATPEQARVAESIAIHCGDLALQWRKAGDEAQAHAFEIAAKSFGAVR